MKPIRAFIYDDNEAELDAMVCAIGRMFNDHGIDIDAVPFLTKSIDSSLEKKLLSERPDIVIVDNHFGDSTKEQMYGQAIISRVKGRLPDSVFILLTKQSIRVDSLHLRFPQADIVASKLGVERAYPDYVDWLMAEVTCRVRRARIDAIDMGDCESCLGRLRSRPDRGKSRSITSREVESLIEQVCHTGGTIQGNVIEAVRLKPLTGGLSDAAVCTISVKNKYCDYDVPAVIKIMDQKSAKREALNHAKFVKWVLPYSWRVDVIGRGVTDEFGAICYSFAHGGSGEPESLAEIIENGACERVVEVLSRVFDPHSKAWYSNDRKLNTALGVYLAKKAPYFYKAEEETSREDKVISLVEEICKISKVRMNRIDGVGVICLFGDRMLVLSGISARLSLIKEISDTTECISHGDLNANNILGRVDK